MTVMDGINLAVGVMSLVLGGLAIWLSIHFFGKSKDAERDTVAALTAIKTQSDALQKLTGRWMDRFTRHATEPTPVDESLMQLVQVVASLPNTILTQFQVIRQPDSGAAQAKLTREIVDAYIALYYYTAQANVLGQIATPSEAALDTDEALKSELKAIIDGSCSDFNKMADLLNMLERSLVESSALNHLLQQASRNWQPQVRRFDQLLAERRAQQGG